jgi:hypothetical protein
MTREFTYKGEKYWVDDEGNVFIRWSGRKVGKIDKNGKFTIERNGAKERGWISWNGKVYEEGALFEEDAVGEEEDRCLLTTVCIKHAGLSDDCPELQIMRSFRDKYIRSLPDGSKLIEEYYQIAPLIVERIKSEGSADIVFNNLLKTLRNIVELIRAGRNSEALFLCKQEFEKLRNKYGV